MSHPSPTGQAPGGSLLLPSVLAVLAVVFVGLACCAVFTPGPKPQGEAHASHKGHAAPALAFTEVAQQLGLNMRHAPGKRERTLPEDTGSGLAWGDIDGDGDWDLYVVNYAAPWEGQAADAGSNQLFRNDDGRFVNITAAAGVADAMSFGLGASFADYDNDGDEDLYVSNFGPNRLFRNEGNNTFTEVGAAAGVDNSLLSCGVAWGDVDRDGDLDLYVCNYVNWFPGDPNELVVAEDEGVTMSIPITVDPYSYEPQANAFYRNNGDGTFAELAASLNIANPEGRSLEVAMIDLDGDGWLDLYVNNDLSTNRLYRNMGSLDLRFADLSDMTGTADPRGSMGLGIGELGNMGGTADGLPDLVLTHWFTESNAIYRSRSHAGSDLSYEDASDLLGMSAPSAPTVGWGTCLVDFDLDGDLDVMVANGSTTEQEEQVDRLIAEPLHLFQSDGARFAETSASAGAVFAGRYSARGLATADFDQDGDVDVAINDNHGNLLLLRNDTETTYESLVVTLEAPAFRRVGARLEATIDGVRHVRWAVADSSFLSGHAPEAVFGLGEAQKVERLEVHWIGGEASVWTEVPAGRFRAKAD